MRWRENPRIRPSTSLRYAQGERKFLLTFLFPFVLSVARRAKLKYERGALSTNDLGNLEPRACTEKLTLRPDRDIESRKQ